MAKEPGQKLTPRGRPIRQPSTGWSDSKDLAQLWRLLGNIRSGDESKLSVRYSGNGITLTPIEETKKQKIPSNEAGSTIFPAIVQSKISDTDTVNNPQGLNNMYFIDVYRNGRYQDNGFLKTDTGNGGTALPVDDQDVPCFIWQIDPLTVLPAGTFIFALEIDNHFESQVPIWL
jgi:hypothetical protein